MARCFEPSRIARTAQRSFCRTIPARRTPSGLLATLCPQIVRELATGGCPPHKPSGMEKATDRPESGTSAEDAAGSKRRGPGVSKLPIDRRVTLTVEAPPGSRHKGYEEIVVQDLVLKAETTLYRRERWETPDGKRLMAPLDGGIVGGCGPHLHRLVLMLHFQGQMTCEDRGAPNGSWRFWSAWAWRFPSGRWCGSCAPSWRASAPRTKRCCGRGS